MVLEMGQSKAHDGMLCPHCKVTLSMSTRANTEIDYCPKCRGVWLDRGELDKIIERSLSEIAPTTPAAAPITKSDREYERKEKRDYKKRKKSWLYEIFDELT